MVLVVVSWLVIVELAAVLSVLVSTEEGLTDVSSVVIFDIWTFFIDVVRVSAVPVGISWLLVVKFDATATAVVLIEVELSDVASVAIFDIVEVNIWALLLSVILVDVDVVVDLMIIVVPLPFGWESFIIYFHFYLLVKQMIYNKKSKLHKR